MTTYTIELKTAEANTLGKLIGEAALFASADTMRPILAAVRFERHAGCLRLVATDSYALGIFDTKTELAEGFDAQLVEADTLAAVAKTLAKLKYGPVTLTFADKWLEVETSDTMTKVRLIDGEFPRYEQLNPTIEPHADGWPALNTTYLALFGKLLLARQAPKRGKSVSFGLKFECFGPLKPVRFTGTSEDCDFVGLLMPVRLK